MTNTSMHVRFHIPGDFMENLLPFRATNFSVRDEIQ